MGLSSLIASIVEAASNALHVTSSLSTVHRQEGKGLADGDVLHEPASEHDVGGEDSRVRPDEYGWLRHPRISVRPSHQGRWGGKISPSCVVWHCTDMRPNSGPALSRARAASAGKGNGEHFVVWEDGTIIQHTPVTRNANHAGGPGSARVNGFHVNQVSIGIELCNPGHLKLDGTDLICDDGPTRIPILGATGDGRRGWRIPYTERQLASVHWLCESVLPYCLTLGNRGESVALTWVGRETSAGPRYGLRHSDINPTQKTDPGPLLNTRYLHDLVWRTKTEIGL